MIVLLLCLQQITIPPPTGFVNDFARVLDSQSIRHMEAVIAEIRDKTRGEIAVVTLPDIGDREASDVALQIGRQWGVGARAEAGDPAKNLGVVILLVPMKNHEPGTGQIFISTGRGAEGFLTDARVGRIRDAMIPFLAREAYGEALSLGVDLIASAFEAEFGVTLTNPEYVRPPPVAQRRQKDPAGLIVMAIILVILVSALSRLGRRRRRRRWGPWWWGGGGLGGGGWGGFGGRGGGWGGGGGGGFGGFGGGGGFSGGGAGGRF
ncbi:MAG TPA: TPM domain-containing protein [Gemmatimonadales bacterium]|nr:TPM domain-containing protein [Gemmatimonadales bacterium]